MTSVSKCDMQSQFNFDNSFTTITWNLFLLEMQSLNDKL